MKHRSINVYLASSLIVLFLCAIKANASEVEMGSCKFTAPDKEFVKEFNKLGINFESVKNTLLSIEFSQR